MFKIFLSVFGITQNKLLLELYNNSLSIITKFKAWKSIAHKNNNWGTAWKSNKKYKNMQ
jgi:hypothetical protein